MREPYTEDLANHGGPESCVAFRKERGRCVDRGMCGHGIEPLNRETRVPTLSKEAEGQMGSGVYRELLPDLARPLTRCTHKVFLRENREIPFSLRPDGGPCWRCMAAREGKPQDEHAREREVGRARSTCEAREQRNSCG
jgi:hypothetical protein